MPETPPFRSVNDETLAYRAQHGCIDSFAELVARFQTPLLRFLKRRTPTTEDAEDLVQEVFVRAYVKLDRYRADWPFAAWLFTLARRLGINHHRRRQLTLQPLVVVCDTSSDPAQVIADRERADRLWDLAAAVLTESQWSSLWLYYVQDLSTLEISHVLSCSPGAVKALLHRGRTRLAAELNTPDPQPSGVRTPQAWLDTVSAACRELEFEHEE